MLDALTSWRARHAPPRQPSLPEHGVLYFDHLYGQYLGWSAAPLTDQADRPTSLNPDVRPLVEELVSKRRNASLKWNDLYTLELMLTRLEPPEKLRRRLWSLRARYRDVAGLQEYEAYLASKPPEFVDPPEAAGQLNGAAVKAWRADAEYLLSELYLRYALAPVHERQRNRLSKVAAGAILVGLVFVLGYTFFAVRAPAEGGASPTPTFVDFRVTTLTVVVFLGAMGGLVSVQQRLQSASDAGDQLYNVSELGHAKSSLVSAVSGATFAAVLYLLITAGLLQGGLFPVLGPPPDAGQHAPARGLSVVQFLVQTGPASAADYAKLMIWSFLAGFAERLVPDTLSRFVARKETETQATP